MAFSFLYALNFPSNSYTLGDYLRGTSAFRSNITRQAPAASVRRIVVPHQVQAKIQPGLETMFPSLDIEWAASASSGHATARAIDTLTMRVLVQHISTNHPNATIIDTYGFGPTNVLPIDHTTSRPIVECRDQTRSTQAVARVTTMLTHATVDMPSPTDFSTPRLVSLGNCAAYGFSILEAAGRNYDSFFSVESPVTAVDEFMSALKRKRADQIAALPGTNHNTVVEVAQHTDYYNSYLSVARSMIKNNCTVHYGVMHFMPQLILQP